MQNIRSRCFTKSEKLLFCRAQLTGVYICWHPNTDRKMCFFLGPSNAFYVRNAYLTCHLAFCHSAELFRGTPSPVFWSSLECAGGTWGTNMPLLLWRSTARWKSEFMEILAPKLISAWIYKLGITTSGSAGERNKLLLPEMKSTWSVCWWQHQNQLQVPACGCSWWLWGWRGLTHSWLQLSHSLAQHTSLQASISEGSYTPSVWAALLALLQVSFQPKDTAPLSLQCLPHLKKWNSVPWDCVMLHSVWSPALPLTSRSLNLSGSQCSAGSSTGPSHHCLNDLVGAINVN